MSFFSNTSIQAVSPSQPRVMVNGISLPLG